MHVQSIVTQRIGYPVVTLQATVTVVKGLGVPDQGATVSGTFSGMADGLPFTKSASATTNASGIAVINGGKNKKKTPPASPSAWATSRTRPWRMTSPSTR